MSYDKGPEQKGGLTAASAAELGLGEVFAKAAAIESSVPAPAYTLGLTDGTPEDERVDIRQEVRQLGHVVPRRFLRLSVEGVRRTPTYKRGWLDSQGRWCRRRIR